MAKCISITVLNRFEFRIGNIYTIQFPKGIPPLTGMKFTHKDHTFIIKGIVTHSSPGNKVGLRAQNENIWDCMIDEASSTELPHGENEIGICEGA